jgi:phenol hydroxylase P0 protein
MSEEATAASFDALPRYVRVQRYVDGDFVEFAFGIGSPELMVDLILPRPAFREFCQKNKVVDLTPEQERVLDFERSKWRYGKPGITE